MDNFDKYSYARTLRFLEAYYPYDNEDIHYANVMLSMNQCKTIDELIEVRERLKTKISKMGSVTILDKLPKRLIEDLSENTVLYNHWSSNILVNLISDVNSCYDENIFRLFWESDVITVETCGEFFINLSRCEEKSKYTVPIINVAKERSNIDVSELLTQIAQRYNNFGMHWKEFKEFKEGMNGYIPAKMVVEEDFAYLMGFNWRLLPEQKSLYREIDREEQKKKEELAKLREERERQEKREKENKRKREKQNETILIVISSIIGIGIMFAIISAGKEVSNIFFFFLLWLAIMKTIINKL